MWGVKANEQVNTKRKVGIDQLESISARDVLQTCPVWVIVSTFSQFLLFNDRPGIRNPR